MAEKAYSSAAKRQQNDWQRRATQKSPHLSTGTGFRVGAYPSPRPNTHHPAPKPCYPQLMTKHTYHPIPAKTPTLRQLYCQNQPLYAYCINSLTPFLHIFSSFSRPFPSFSRPFSSLSAKIHPTGNKNFLYCQLAEKVFLPAANRQQNDRQR